MFQEISLIGSILPLAGAALFKLGDGLRVINLSSGKLKLKDNGATAMVPTGQSQNFDVVGSDGSPKYVLEVKDFRKQPHTTVNVYETGNKEPIKQLDLHQEGVPYDIATGITGIHYEKTQDVPVNFSPPITVVFRAARKEPALS